MDMLKNIVFVQCIITKKIIGFIVASNAILSTMNIGKKDGRKLTGYEKEKDATICGK
jgi:hypothetical protein